MTTQEVMNYLEQSLKPQIATLTEAINLALQSSSTVVANSSGAMAILSSALSATAGNVVLENGVVVPNLKKMLDEVQAVSGSIQAESAQAIAELKEQSKTLIAQMSDAAQGINDNLESGATSSTYSSEKIQSLLSELKRTLETAIATAKNSLLETQATQGEKITALESAKQDHAGKIEALENAKSEQAEKISVLESGVAEAKELAQNAGVKSINGETGEITGVVKLEGAQTLENKTLNAPILNNATLNGTTTLATATLNAPTLTDPKISLGEAGVGKAGQVLMSQGEGKAPKWKRITNEFIYLPEVGEEAEAEERARVIGVNEGNIITITPQDYTESIRLPDIATLEVGAQYSISNMGQYPVTIYFAPNKILGSVATEATELLVVAEEQGRKFWQHNLHGFAYTKMFATAKVGSEYMHKVDNDRYFLLSNQANTPVKYFDFKRNVKVEIAIRGQISENFRPLKFDEHTFVVCAYNNPIFSVYFINIVEGKISNVYSTQINYNATAVAKVGNYLMFFRDNTFYTKHYLFLTLNLDNNLFTQQEERNYFVDVYSGKLYHHDGSYFYLIRNWNGERQDILRISSYSNENPKNIGNTFIVDGIEFRILHSVNIHIGDKKIQIAESSDSRYIRYYGRTGGVYFQGGGIVVGGNTAEFPFKKGSHFSINRISEDDFVLFSFDGNKIFRNNKTTALPKHIPAILYDDIKMVSINHKYMFDGTLKEKRFVVNFVPFNNVSEVAFKQKVITRIDDKILLAQIADEQPTATESTTSTQGA